MRLIKLMFLVVLSAISVDAQAAGKPKATAKPVIKPSGTPVSTPMIRPQIKPDPEQSASDTGHGQNNGQSSDAAVVNNILGIISQGINIIAHQDEKEKQFQAGMSIMQHLGNIILNAFKTIKLNDNAHSKLSFNAQQDAQIKQFCQKLLSDAMIKQLCKIIESSEIESDGLDADQDEQHDHQQDNQDDEL